MPTNKINAVHIFAVSNTVNMHPTSAVDAANSSMATFGCTYNTIILDSSSQSVTVTRQCLPFSFFKHLEPNYMIAKKQNGLCSQLRGSAINDNFMKKCHSEVCSFVASRLHHQTLGVEVYQYGRSVTLTFCIAELGSVDGGGWPVVCDQNSCLQCRALSSV